MDNNIFDAVIEKFEHDIVDALASEYDFEGTDNYKESLVYFFDKKISLDDVDETIKQQIEDKYYSDYEFNEFDDWWKFNGDDWEQEYKKKHGDKDDMMVIAFDEWMEKYGLECWNNFDGFVGLVKNIELVVVNHSEDKIEFICDTYYENDLENGELFKTSKSIFLYESDFEKMCEILTYQFGLDVKCIDTPFSHYLSLHDAKIHDIAKKLI